MDSQAEPGNQEKNESDDLTPKQYRILRTFVREEYP